MKAALTQGLSCVCLPEKSYCGEFNRLSRCYVAFFINIATRIAGAVSALVLLMIAIGSINSDGITVLVSCIGVGLWIWLEIEERKAKSK